MAKIGVIGGRDSVMLFQAAGIATFFAEDAPAASRLLHRLAREDYQVIYLTEPLFAQCGEAIDKYKAEPIPAIIPIPDNTGTRGIGMASVRANVEKAIGKDILFSEGR